MADPIDAIAQDDPRAAIPLYLRALSEHQRRGRLVDEFWTRVALAEAYQVSFQTSRFEEQRLKVQELAQSRQLGESERLTSESLELDRISRDGKVDPDAFGARVQALRLSGQSRGAERGLCQLANTETFAYVNFGANDLAWRAAQRLEACATALKDLAYFVASQEALACVAGRTGRYASARQHLERALAALAGPPARYRRAGLLFNLAVGLRNQGELQAARDAAAESFSLFSALKLQPWMRTSESALALIETRLMNWPEALFHAEQALNRPLDSPGLPSQVELVTTRLAALVAMGRPEVAAVLTEANAVKVSDLGPVSAVRLQRTRAAAHAFLGQHEAAFGELEQAEFTYEASQRHLRDKAALALQSRHEALQREVEGLQLRGLMDDRLPTRRENAFVQQVFRPLNATLALVLGIALSLIAGAMWLRRRPTVALGRRQSPGELPDARAGAAAAQSWWQLMRLMDQPLCLVLLDADQPNDRAPAVAPDARERLVALTALVRPLMRQTDLLAMGQGGGLLLVMPGLRPERLAGVEARLQSVWRQGRDAGQTRLDLHVVGASVAPGSRAAVSHCIEVIQRQMQLKRMPAGRPALAFGSPTAHRNDHPSPKAVATR